MLHRHAADQANYANEKKNLITYIVEFLKCATFKIYLRKIYKYENGLQTIKNWVKLLAYIKKIYSKMTLSPNI